MGGKGQSEEERRHARQVNAARAAEGLATKSTGSVSRSKARALAHRAAVGSKAIPGEAIGAPRSFRRRRLKHEHDTLWYCVRLSRCREGNPPSIVARANQLS